MRDHSPGGTKTDNVGAVFREEPACLARFSIGQHWFRLVLCHDDDSREAGEVVRFELGGSAVAIVEDAAPAASAEALDIIARLTGRELQIAALVAEGDGTKNIAHKLRISEWTVGTHLRRIFAKLNVDNRAAMVYLCAPLIKSAAAAATCGNGASRGGDGRMPREVRAATRPAEEHEASCVEV